ncbi:hypothetical protein [Desulforhabdus sp. TSK]|uniref:hypothetical protein n=1 Tax=Desulforhabdus sp. TSK TaxID=2925014 RepID=UPI001FC83164|nr:hypothetical protein [Desulforhabdus sp. TSK]GKT07165.1 hypothetical protein DSTSK_04700 [Desulforhabdus sp. TSK]
MLPLVLFFVLLIILVASGIGVGFLLNWMMPTVDFDIGVLIGVISLGFSLDFVARFLSSYGEQPLLDDEVEEVIIRPKGSSRVSRRRR